MLPLNKENIYRIWTKIGKYTEFEQRKYTEFKPRKYAEYTAILLFWKQLLLHAIYYYYYYNYSITITIKVFVLYYYYHY